MFSRILIANRGEIAVRIIRACREMGIESIAVYSQADAETLPVQLADTSVCIGPGPVRESYLNAVNILSAAVVLGAEAIHPGYGMLSESVKFAQMCQQCNLTLIGPSPEAMSAMGDKLGARQTMLAHNVPVLPGSAARVESLEQALADAEKAGYPVLVKASAGGGGRGMRRVNHPEEMEGALHAAQAEARSAFGNDTVYIEKMVSGVRHVEVQVIFDKHGNGVHLFERDCSLQYRRQKLLEESPSPMLTDKMRREMGEAALRAGHAVGYTGVGTVEFLVDANGNYYFIEMNTRIQVEHPVTEMVTGIDLVREQIRVAAGLPLGFSQEDISLRGHAIECRICANSPEHGFRPSCGTVKLKHQPGGMGVRFDSLLYDGCVISPHYDSMIGKLIVHAPTREQAIARMRGALSELVIEGIDTNTEFQDALVGSDFFASGTFNTDTVEEMRKDP